MSIMQTENKLTKLIRLLKVYETELKVTDGNVSIVLNSDGSGTIFAPYKYADGNDAESAVFDFKDGSNDLIAFLEGSELTRTLMIRGKA